MISSSRSNPVALETASKSFCLKLRQGSFRRIHKKRSAYLEAMKDRRFYCSCLCLSFPLRGRWNKISSIWCKPTGSYQKKYIIIKGLFVAVCWWFYYWVFLLIPDFIYALSFIFGGIIGANIVWELMQLYKLKRVHHVCELHPLKFINRFLPGM